MIGSGGSGGLLDQATDPVHHNLVGIASPSLGIGGLTNNGGPTQTIALFSGSPAIDAGSSTLVNEYALANDQRGTGFPRIVNDNIDIGAFERPIATGSATVYTVNCTGTAGLGSGNSGDLVYVVNKANSNSNLDGSLIKFDPAEFNSSTPRTIALDSTLVLNDGAGPEAIDGPGAGLVTIVSDALGVNPVGIFPVLQIDSGTTATLSGITISGGSATGIRNSVYATSTINNCAIINNRSTIGAGGGIQNYGWLMVEDSTIAGNRAQYSGGGISNSGTLTVLDTTIANNVAMDVFGGTPDGGGGISNYGTLTAVNTTIAYNQTTIPGTGGGLDVDLYNVAGGPVILYNTIVVGNSDPNGADDVGTTTNLSSSPDSKLSSASAYNLVGVDATGSLTNGMNGNLVGVVNSGLGPLANHGGATPTIPLLAGSPAISAGNVAIANAYSLTVDRRGAGFPRTVNGTVDIGAFEQFTLSSGPTVYSVNSAGTSGSGSGNSGDLVYVVNQANANTNTDGSVIEFDPSIFNSSSPQTITLTSTLKLSERSGPEVIQGPGVSILTISGNNSVGVLQVESGVTATLSGLTIEDGQWVASTAASGSSGGAGIDNLGILAVTGCTIEDNTSAGSSERNGGGIANEVAGLMTVTGSTIVGNSAGSGGGIFNAGRMVVTGSAIASNSANNQGGGLDSDGLLIVTNSTIADNQAASGGGVFNFIDLFLSGSTIADNHASSEGGGIELASGPHSRGYVNNSVVALNTDTNGSDDIAGSVVNRAYGLVSSNNLIGTGGSGGLTDGTSGNLVGVTDLGLSPLADNGGPTETMALLPCSPAIGVGSVALAIDFTKGSALTTDQRGQPRIVDGKVDIGAFEGQEEFTTMTVAASPGISVFGQSVTITATVTPSDGSPVPTATGSIQFEIDGSDFGSPAVLVDGSATSAAISSLAVANHTVSAVYASNSADFVVSTGSTSFTVETANEANIQSVVNNAPSSSGGSVTIQTTSDAAVTTAVQAVDVATPSSPVTVTLDLGGGTYTTDTQVSTQPDVTLIIQNGTLVGGSPALVVDSGTVLLENVTATNATAAPTILVNGGSLTVRNSTIEGSTGYAEAAILITGGSVNLGTGGSPGDNVINVNGTGELVHNATTSSVSDIGNTLEDNGTPLASPYLSFTVLTSSVASSVYGQSVTLTAAVRAGSSGDGTPSGSVTFLDTTSGANLGTASITSGVATLVTSALAVGSHTITADYIGNSSFAFSLSTLTQTVQQDNTTTSVTLSASTPSFGQAVTFTAKVAANAPGAGTPTGSVDFFDTTTGVDLGSVALSGAKASMSSVSLPVGGNTIKVSYSGDTSFVASSTSTSSITIGQSIIVLDPSAGGALSLSGNASIKLTGGVYVDSSSSTALLASGNAAIKASVIDVRGGVQKSGSASFSPTPTTGAAVMADPLASLAEPSTSALTNYGSESLSGNSSATIKPGIYSQITVSGNGTLTMNSGVYIIEGGGFTVSGNASVAGSGVMIVNAGSKYPATGGTYGSITLTGNGSYNLSPPTTGTYAGIVFFQTRDNSKALSLSGNAAGMTGTVYAPDAQLAESGNAALNAAVIVDTLTISGNGVNNTVTLSSPNGTVAYTPAQIRTAYGISAPLGRRHGPDHCHCRCIRRSQYLPGSRRLRFSVWAHFLGADALQPVRAGVFVSDRPQPVRPVHISAEHRSQRPRHRKLGSGGGARRRVGSRHRARRPDHSGRGQQPIAGRSDGERRHGCRSAWRVGGVDELGLRRRPGRLRQRRGNL